MLNKLNKVVISGFTIWLKLLLAVVANHIALDLKLGQNGAAGGAKARTIGKNIHASIYHPKSKSKYKNRTCYFGFQYERN